ncbi:MAG: hypothetical protein CR968_05405 [Flavobacteriia bacterium]|nr:MAG: hypothetical protein CR968_05405 [Flavobacteriia bacterium]
MTTKPKDLISIKTFNEGVKRYETHVLSRLRDNQTKSVWFDLETVKSYIAFIEQEAAAKKLEISGLRLHMMAKDTQEHAVTLAFAPTVKKTNERGEVVHHSFDVISSEENHPVELSTPQVRNDFTDAGILNNGIACPPKCG